MDNLYFCLMKYALGFAFIISVALASCSGKESNGNSENEASSPETASTVPSIGFTVTAAFPHDTSSFTEGLLFYKGSLLESAGNYNRSRLLRYDLKSGKRFNDIKLDDAYFGEGICVFRDTIYQMTWKEKKVLVYTKDFKKIKELPLPIEGWGLTTDSTHLIASDGSSNLYFFEPSTFRLLRTQGITENGAPLSNINELEYIHGIIYANQWQTNSILKIDVATGQVIGRLDLSELERRAKIKNPQADVLNGIAYEPVTKKLYVTGKYWPEIYELQFNF